MNYFLPPEKMRIVLEYPFARDYFEGKTRRFEFLENLEIFKSELIERGLTENDIELLKHELSEREFNEIINSLPAEIKESALFLKIENDYAKVAGISKLSSMNITGTIPLIEQMLKASYEYVRRTAIKALSQLESKLSIILIERMLKDQSSFVRSTAIEALLILHSKSSIPLIEQMLQDPEQSVRSEATNALSLLSSNIKYLKYHRLYTNQEDRFFEPGKKGTLGEVKRREFAKTGSRTILLGGTLAGKVIIRIVSEKAFLAWKRALESVDAWKEAGFDYVPVEPILMKKGKLLFHKFEKDGEIYYRVYTKILLGTALYISPFVDSLQPLCKKISAVLEELKIEHGHLHLGNFIVEMHEGKPRLYVIDFDEAVSPPP